MGYLRDRKVKYKPKEKNIVKLENYIKNLDNKFVKKLLI
jgi:hypothetical protein